MKIHTREPAPLPYERAPEGSPDTYRLTAPVRYVWADPPARFVRRVACPVMMDGAGIWLDRVSAPPRVCLELPKGFHFDVSVAPSAAAALKACPPHDWLYEHADALARHWGCSKRSVLKFADHWFLALMRHTRFTFKRTYFLGVRAFGYWFNRLTRALPH